MRRPRGVIFDLGGTILYLESGSIIDGNRRSLEFVETETDITVEEVQATADDLSKSIFQAAEESNVQVRAQEFERLLFETLGLSLSIDYPEMEKVFWNAALRYRPNDGILDVLDILDKYQIKTGILSNSSFTGAVLLEELEKHNLAHRFSFLISTADYGIRKPDKHIFDVAIKKIGLEPEEIWFAGDKVGYDIKGAINSGLFPVLYDWRNESPVINEEHLIVNNWYEFRDKIELLYTNSQV
ncbi:HAD family hydrolase [Chloroflexota bacterium]